MNRSVRGGVVGAALKHYRCRFRAVHRTITVECWAPSAEQAAYAVGVAALNEDAGAPWVQVVPSEWSPLLGEYVDPANAIIIARGDAEEKGADRVVLGDRAANGAPLDR